MSEEASHGLGLEAKYSCLICHKRKVKCDRGRPCSNCARNNVECEYRAPPPPKRRKRNTEIDLVEKLRKYEHLLKKQGIQLDEDGNLVDGDDNDLLQSSDTEERSSKRPSLQPPAISKPKSQSRTESSFKREEGTLVADAGKARYLESSLWVTLTDSLPNSNSRNLLHSDQPENGTEDDSSQSATGQNQPNAILFGKTRGPDPIDAFPRPEHVLILWRHFLSNVDPLIKMTHTPTVEKLVQLSCQNVHSLSRNNLTLLFAIFLNAATSMDNDVIEAKLGQTRSSLSRKLAIATERCFVRAGLLQTTDLTLLTAFLIYLYATRNQADVHITWTLVGVSARIAQRIGLHRHNVDGLKPFEIEMRRRVWRQLLILDWATSELAGTSCFVQFAPSWWTMTNPKNVNDSDLNPNMTEMPVDRIGATDMIFCMLRCEFGNFFSVMKGGDDYRTASDKTEPTSSDVDHYIDEVEKRIEHKFLRFCDPINPLHVMITVVSRAAICSMRIRTHHQSRVGDNAKPFTPEDHSRLFQLSLKALQYDNLIMNTPSLKGYHWHVRDFFQFHPLIYLLVAIRKNRVGEEVEEAWHLIDQTYTNRPELAERKKGLHVAVGSLAIQAWDTREAELKRRGQVVHIPSCISKLRASDPSKRTMPVPNQTVPVIPPLPQQNQSSVQQFAWNQNQPPQNVFSDPNQWDIGNYWAQFENLMVNPDFPAAVDSGMNTFPFNTMEGYFMPTK
jgi:hypothetical protein